jgi:hypothetical protein
MQQILEGLALAGEPLLRDVLEAIRVNCGAGQSSSPAEEIELLRLLAD